MKTVPLKRVATIRTSNVDKKSTDGDVPVRLCNYTDVYYRDAITPDLDLMSTTATRDQVEAFHLQPGDVVITKDSETAEDIGVPAFVERSAPDLVCGYHLAILRPRIDLLEPRFLFWSMSSQHVRDEFAVSATGVTRFGLRAESIGQSQVPDAPRETQVAVAKHLDAETARIDALCAAKRRLIVQAEERHRVAVAEAIAPHPRVPLKHVVRYTEGPGIMADDFRDEGVPLVRVAGVTGPRVTLVGCNYLDPSEVRRRWLHFALEEGDRVISASATMGTVSTVGAEAAGAVPYTGLIRIRPQSAFVDVRYIEHFLGSAVFMDQIELLRTGTTLQHFGPSHLGLVAVPFPPVEQQQRIADRLDFSRERTLKANAILARQIELIIEHRRALITAAVTGELAIPA